MSLKDLRGEDGLRSVAFLSDPLSKYCAISRDEILIEEQCVTQAEQITDELTKCKTVLEEFFKRQKKTCVPVKVQTDEGDRTIYLRSVEKTSYKAVNEDAFKRVIEKLPTSQDLQEVFNQLENPSANFIDVYASWIFNTLYDQNTTQRSVFEVSDKKEKGKKNANTDEVNIPDAITQATEDWMLAAHNIKRLKLFKKGKMDLLAQEKKTIEPVIETFLASRPKDKQEQKVMMNLHGEDKPYYIKRIVETRRPPLSLNKAKPLILTSVQQVVKATQPQLLNKPFQSSDADRLFRNDMLLSMLYAEFRTQFETFKQTAVKVSTHVELREKGDGNRKRKRGKRGGDRGGDGGGGDRGGDGGEDDADEES